jgi:DNA-binding NtrC family response regulator
MNKKPIIVMDDEKNALVSMRATLKILKYKNVITCQNLEEFKKVFKEQGADVILLDMLMPDISGAELQKQINSEHPDLPVIMTTGVNELEPAMDCIRNGAYDYLSKPISPDTLKLALDRALKVIELKRFNEALSDGLLGEDLKNPEIFESIKTADSKLLSIFKYIEAVAPSSHSILVTGETGTGKEQIARSIHKASGRSGEFVSVNIAGLDDSVLADTLFGHVKGAFTGADAVRVGLVENADNGTLFLDEVGDLSIPSQIKLLRLLQENEYMPLGADSVKKSNCRIVAATSKSLKELQDNDCFRRDLFFRLKTHHVHIPALRERKGDISILVQLFLKSAAKEFGKNVPTAHPEISKLLSVYNFPGNIRELKNIIYDSVAKHDGKMLSFNSIKSAIGLGSDREIGFTDPVKSENLFETIEKLPTFKEAETLLLGEAIRRSEGNKTLAASILGVTPSAVFQRLNKKKK